MNANPAQGDAHAKCKCRVLLCLLINHLKLSSCLVLSGLVFSCLDRVLCAQGPVCMHTMSSLRGQLFFSHTYTRAGHPLNLRKLWCCLLVRYNTHHGIMLSAIWWRMFWAKACCDPDSVKLYAKAGGQTYNTIVVIRHSCCYATCQTSPVNNLS